MSNMMQRGVFYIAKALEAVSIKLGFGKFEVGENWQCRDCVESNTNLCDDCISSWIHELGHLNYSDTYERKLNTTAGTAMLVMGIVALIGNASMGLWQGGDLMISISKLFKGALPSILLQRGPWTFYYNLFMVLLWLSAAVVFWGSISVAMFLMAMSPLSQRHRKHMTPSAYAGMFAYLMIYLVLIIADGSSVADNLLVIWPVISGLGMCLTPFVMKKAKEPEVFDKLDSEEKQS